MHLIVMVGEHHLSGNVLQKEVNKPDFGNTVENIWLRVIEKETDVIPLRWMARQVEEGDNAFCV